MPYDNAIYHSGNGKIYATMGPLLAECNGTTGARERLVRMASPLFGDVHLATTANGKLWASLWHVLGGNWNGLAHNRDIYEINLTTLLGTASGWIQNPVPASYPNIGDGPREIQAWGNKLWVGYHADGSQGAEMMQLVDMTAGPPTHASALRTCDVFRMWTFGVDQDTGSSYWASSTNKTIEYTGSTAVGANLSTSGVCTINPHRPIGTCYAANVSKAFAACGNGNLIRANAYGGVDFTAINLELIQANIKAFRARYNAVNGKIYIPDMEHGTVVVYDPQADSGVLKTGFTLPHDCVFTASKAFAVQAGPVGLKEIV
jgi:hypothetical protein